VARRLIGLDIGTNAVRVAEIEPGDPPRLVSFGQVALPYEAMRDGEVADPAAVTATIQRLWKELSLRKGEVRVGIASPRVLVRVVEMPQMSDDDLAGALRFQAQELIPIPLEEAVLDFQVLEAIAPPATAGAPADAEQPAELTETAQVAETQPMVRVLLAATHQETVRTLVGAVRAAGLSVGAVDLVPLALIRAIGRRVSDNGPGAEAIVSIGGGVSVVVVHELGLPRFVRILGSGGRGLTDAIARDLELSIDQAEALKRQGDRAPDDLAQRAGVAMARPLGELVEQIRGSIDYYRTQPDATRVLRVTLTGGAALTPGLVDQLGNLIGVPVDVAAPREHLAVGDIGFPDDQLPGLDPYLPVPVGLALGGLAAGRRINLLGADGRAALDRKRVLLVAGAVGTVLVLALGGLWWQKHQAVADEQDTLAQVEDENAALQHQIDTLGDAQRTQAEIEAIGGQVDTLLKTDISWSRMLQEIARTIPSDTWLTAFQGSATTDAAGTTTPATPGTTTAGGIGSANFTVVGLDFTSVSAWIQRIGTQIPSFSNLWVPSATKSGAANSADATGGVGRALVDFTSNATITEAAASNRLERLHQETR
jgi:type IV pilus assembly protein PilM